MFMCLLLCQKFGDFEGKTFKDLFAAAQKHNKKWTDFTPEGAETYEEVRRKRKNVYGIVNAVCQQLLFVWDRVITTLTLNQKRVLYPPPE